MGKARGYTDSPIGRHHYVLRELGGMRRVARRLAEESVAAAWDESEIEFLHWVMDFLEDAYYRAERLEDQGQFRLPW